MYFLKSGMTIGHPLRHWSQKTIRRAITEVMKMHVSHHAIHLSQKHSDLATLEHARPFPQSCITDKWIETPDQSVVESTTAVGIDCDHEFELIAVRLNVDVATDLEIPSETI